MKTHQDLLRTLSNITIYKYKFDKTYRYISPLCLKEIMNKPNKDECFFSNIYLSFPKANDVLK